MAWIAAAVAVIGSIASSEQQSKARAEQREANRQQLNLEKARQRREKLRAQRAQRVERARLLAATEATGAGGSSAQRAGESSLAANIGSELGYSYRQQRTQEQIGYRTQRATDYQGRAAFYGNVSQFALQYA
jgi:hypothetical protein